MEIKKLVDLFKSVRDSNVSHLENELKFLVGKTDKSSVDKIIEIELKIKKLKKVFK